MRLHWDEGLPSFETVEAFYAAAPEEARLRSGESDFGCWWYDGKQAWSGCWRVSCVKNTGEVYAVLERPQQDGRGRVVVLGSVGPEPEGYPNSHAALEGWEQVCGIADSLQWVVDRMAPFRSPAASAAAVADQLRDSTLGVLAGRCVLLLDALRPWDAHSTQVRQLAAELTLAIAQLPLEDPEEEAFTRGLLHGIELYSYSSSQPWAENGVRYVGTTGEKLADAKREMLERRAAGDPLVADPGKVR